MEYLIACILVITFLSPLLGTLVLGGEALLKKPIVEIRISNGVRFLFALYLAGTILLVAAFILLRFRPIEYDGLSSCGVSVYIDANSLVFLLVTAIVSNIIILFSQRYLHRDPGYRRFFMIISLFLFGMTLIICGGNLKTLFAGWEIVGFSSFLLIGFYWHRQAAADSASRTFFIYRFCDVGLLVSMIAASMIWQGNHLFKEIASQAFVDEWVSSSLFLKLMLGGGFILAALGKSAQFPFCYWLPRAMEGPTPSSAIFYGSLSVHAGVYILIRTFPLWYSVEPLPWVLGTIGILSAFLATLCSRMQTNIKGQIGYASVAQVGVMFVELALGFPSVALFHLTGNALLRCFQLLVSPSILAQQLQIHSALEGQVLKSRFSIENWFPAKLDESLHGIGLNDAYLEFFIKSVVVQPFQKIAQWANAAHSKVLESLPFHGSKNVSDVVFSALSLPALWQGLQLGGEWSRRILILMGLFFALSALGERIHIRRLLFSAMLANCLPTLVLLADKNLSVKQPLLYMVSYFAAFFLSLSALNFMKKRRELLKQQEYNGLFLQFPLASTLLLAGLIGMMGLPFSTTFILEDNLLEQLAHVNALGLTVSLLIFVLNGISLTRLYTRVFWGVRDAEMVGVDLDYSVGRTSFQLAFFILVNAAVLFNESLFLS